MKGAWLAKNAKFVRIHFFFEIIRYNYSRHKRAVSFKNKKFVLYSAFIGMINLVPNTTQNYINLVGSIVPPTV